MSGIPSELAGLAFFVVTGWVALWPARRTMGPVAYHLAALPTGLLAAAVASSVGALTNRPLDLVSAAGGAIVLAVVVQLLLRYLGTPAVGMKEVRPVSFALAAASGGVLASVFGVLRLTVTNNDSVMSYWPLGVELARKGVLTPGLIATRSVLIPSMNAIYYSFGSEWAYVVYPMLAATLLAWLAMTLLAGPLSSLKPHTAWTIVGVAVAALVLEPSFLFHSVFVHSHMISAIYLLMSLTCVWLAARPAHGGETAEVDRTYLVLAGVFATGLMLARPDGLAYLFVPSAAAMALIARPKVELKAVAAYFAPVYFMLVATYGVAYLELGMWLSGKLSGKRTLAVLLVVLASAAGPWVVAWLDKRLPFRITGERFQSIFVAATAALMVAALLIKHTNAREALANAWLNIFAGHGGYNYLWWGVLALLLLSLLTHDALRRDSWTRSPFLSIVLFYVIALVVHGISHAGRVGAGDSLNRVVFHTLPVIVWYLAAVAGRIFGDQEKALPAVQ